MPVAVASRMIWSSVRTGVSTCGPVLLCLSDRTPEYAGARADHVAAALPGTEQQRPCQPRLGSNWVPHLERGDLVIRPSPEAARVPHALGLVAGRGIGIDYALSGFIGPGVCPISEGAATVVAKNGGCCISLHPPPSINRRHSDSGHSSARQVSGCRAF
jgi:hypothetical protein